jgi:pyrimidine operon attenuation protein/uracil phosphoribosyltransferase
MPENVRTLLTKAQMAEGVAALAKSICEANQGAESIALVGIFTRGVPLAKRIAAEIEKLGCTRYSWHHRHHAVSR